MSVLLGVVLTLPEPAAGELQGWRSRVGDPGGNVIPPHVTLLPPTRVATEAMPVVHEHLCEVAAVAQPFEMHLQGTGTFRPVSQVVFVAVASGISYCEAVEADLRCGPLGRPLEYPYHPHVTVAHDVPEPMLDLAYDGLAHFEARFPVDRLTVYARPDDGSWARWREYPFGPA